jgi:hypothetical protein
MKLRQIELVALGTIHSFIPTPMSATDVRITVCKNDGTGVFIGISVRQFAQALDLLATAGLLAPVCYGSEEKAPHYVITSNGILTLHHMKLIEGKNNVQHQGP